MKKLWQYIKHRRLIIKHLALRIINSLWFIPMLWVIGFSIAGFAFIFIDWFLLTDAFWKDWHMLWQSHAQGALTMLGAIAGATLTVVSLAFSLMMVVVIQTANAYTPRLLRQFIGDRHNHHVLGILMGIFTYAIVVLRSIQEEPLFVPHLAVNFALFFSIVSIIALISFIHHVASSIEVGSIIRLIRKQTIVLLNNKSYKEVGHPYCPKDKNNVPRHKYENQILATKSGYIQLLDLRVLKDILIHTDDIIEFHQGVGDHVMECTKIATIWSKEEKEKDAQSNLTHQVHEAFSVGDERSWDQDVHYGFQQLTDIALRALSPGINDPTTGSMALDALSELFVLTLSTENHIRFRANKAGDLSVILPKEDLNRLLFETLFPVFDYGKGDCSIVYRLITQLGKMSRVAKRKDDIELLWQSLQAIHRQIDPSQWTTFQVQQLNIRLKHVVEQFEKDALPPFKHPNMNKLT